MPSQLLIIEPQNEIKFKGTFEQGYTTYLKLTNPTQDTVLFKIKTTAPKKYCVRPNSGMLEPNSKVEIAITPQPVYVDPNEKHKHKFMVQSVVAPEGKTNVEQVWKEINPEQLMDYKLKCVFEVPRGATLNDSGDSAVTGATRNDAAKKKTVAAEETKQLPAIKKERFLTTDSDSGSDDSIVLNIRPRHRLFQLASQPHRNPNKESPMIAMMRQCLLLEDMESEKVPPGLSSDTCDDPSSSQNAFPKQNVFENDVQKASLEVSQLREEESKLRSENLQLKEDIMRLRQIVDSRIQRPHSYGPEKTGHAAMIPLFATALAMAFIGIIVGKYFV